MTRSPRHDRDPRDGVHDDSPSSNTSASRPTGASPSRSGQGGTAGSQPRPDPPTAQVPPGGGPKALDTGEGADGRTTHGFTGDDGEHVPASRGGVPPARAPGAAADLGAHGDTRRHGVPRDAAERTSGGDTPDEGGGIAGAEGGPRQRTEEVPGEDGDEAATEGGSRSGNDAQRDSQV